MKTNTVTAISIVVSMLALGCERSTTGGSSIDKTKIKKAIESSVTQHTAGLGGLVEGGTGATYEFMASFMCSAEKAKVVYDSVSEALGKEVGSFEGSYKMSNAPVVSTHNTFRCGDKQGAVFMRLVHRGEHPLFHGDGLWDLLVYVHEP